MRGAWATNWTGLLLLALSWLLFSAGPARAQFTYSTVYGFKGTPDGAKPNLGNLVLSGKNLYGMTMNGGTDGLGTAFEITPANGENPIWSFSGPTSDGAYPDGGLIRDSKGNLYGTTAGGGSNVTCPFGFGQGCGVVFELSPPAKKSDHWTEDILYNFTGGSTSDGATPMAGLIRDAQGNLYGTTNYGNSSNSGTIFKVSPTSPGSDDVLYDFCSQESCSDGAFPEAPLFRNSEGDLYGTTADGGTGCNSQGCGVVFELTSAGEQVLYSFLGEPDGSNPQSPLVMHGGSLYNQHRRCQMAPGLSSS